jgi:hypothetical protein
MCYKNINEMPRCPYMMILQEIYEKAKCFDFVWFIHENRDCNREAHTFAKYACTLRVGRHVWLDSPPVFLSCVPYLKARGPFIDW